MAVAVFDWRTWVHLGTCPTHDQTVQYVTFDWQQLNWEQFHLSSVRNISCRRIINSTGWKQLNNVLMKIISMWNSIGGEVTPCVCLVWEENRRKRESGECVLLLWESIVDNVGYWVKQKGNNNKKFLAKNCRGIYVYIYIYLCMNVGRNIKNKAHAKENTQ